MAVKYWLGLSYDPLDSNNWSSNSLPSAGDSIVVNNCYMFYGGGGTASLRGNITSFGPLASISCYSDGRCVPVDPLGVRDGGSVDPLIAVVLEYISYGDFYCGWVTAPADSVVSQGTSYIDIVGNQNYGPACEKLYFRSGNLSVRGAVKDCEAVINNMIILTSENNDTVTPLLPSPGTMVSNYWSSSLEFVSSSRTGPDAANGVFDTLEIASKPGMDFGGELGPVLSTPFHVTYKPDTRFYVPQTFAITGPSNTTVRVPELHNITIVTDSMDDYNSQTPWSPPVFIVEHPDTPTAIPDILDDSSIKLSQNNTVLIESLITSDSGGTVTDANRAQFITKTGVQIGYLYGEMAHFMFKGGNLSNAGVQGELSTSRCSVREEPGAHMILGTAPAGAGQPCGIKVRKHDRIVDSYRDNWFSDDIVHTYAFVKVTWDDDIVGGSSEECCR